MRLVFVPFSVSSVSSVPPWLISLLYFANRLRTSAASSQSRLASSAVGASATARTIGSVLLARINSAYEEVIREDPEQWLWGHKRWRTRPPGEPPLY